MKNSIEESTSVFSTFDMISTSLTQTPKGFLELLTEKGRHTHKTKKDAKLTITSEFKELANSNITDFEMALEDRLRS